MNREIGRLKMSLDAAEPGLEKLVFLHYPPVYTGTSAPEIVATLKAYDPEMFLRPPARQCHPLCGARRCGRHPL